MKTYPTDRIRNIALIGHSGSGKTTLAEALIFSIGGVSRMGRVEDGTTTCDFDPEEIKKGVSVSIALAPLEVEGCKINLIDSPGSPDFAGEVTAALRVADLAIFVVSAVDGPQVQTRQYWKEAGAAGVPRAVFVNKLDRERADFSRTLGELEAAFGAGLAPVQLPIGAEAGFRGLFDLRSGMAYAFDGETGKSKEDPGAGQPASFDEARTLLLEAIAETDEALLDKYLEEGDLPSKDISEALTRALADGSIIPVLAGAASKVAGTDRLVDFLIAVAPSPDSRGTIPVKKGGADDELEISSTGPEVAQIFKTIADPYVGKLSLFKVYSGSIKPDTVLQNSRTGGDERLHQIFALKGKDHIEVEGLAAGDIAAVAKLGETKTGDTLCKKGTQYALAGIPSPIPQLSLAITPKTKGDEDKLGQSLQRLAEEDPAIRVDRNAETKQMVLSGLGEAHLSIVLERLKRKFGVEVDTAIPKVAYRETIRKPSEGEGKHKKQTGGHGQFGVAHIRVEPLERGSGFEFVDAVVGGVIPRQFIPAVEKGVNEAMDRGFLAGYPLVDIRVTLDDGKHHPVDSNELSFKLAGSLALHTALDNADPALLEPIADVEIVVPDEKVGDVQGDLNSKRGRILGTDPLGDGETAVQAQVPAGELVRYAIDLRSITGGQGRFTMQHSHYEEVPAHLAEKIRAATEAEKKEG